jgi:hypothetical protein
MMGILKLSQCKHMYSNRSKIIVCMYVYTCRENICQLLRGTTFPLCINTVMVGVFSSVSAVALVELQQPLS